MARAIELISARDDVIRYIPEVIAAADATRDSFGFLPHRAYEDFALQKRLIVARDAASDRLAGYVAFGGTPPQTRIFQTYVAPSYRRMGVGGMLIEEVVRRSEELSYLSIRAEIASDIAGANEFYQRHGFRRVRERTGGKTRGRTIITRVKELNSPSLLDFAQFGVPGGPSVNLTLPTQARTPHYLIDLNVLFDVVRRRGRALAAGRVFAAAMDNAANLAVSSEFIEELERTSRRAEPDPIIELARALPRLKKPAQQVIARYRTELAPVLFAHRAEHGKLTVQDESDLAHLATAIEENLDGFITGEKAILARSDWLRQTYGVDVLSPEVFGKTYTSAVRASVAYRVHLNGQGVTAKEVAQEDIQDLRTFLSLQDVPEPTSRAALVQGTSVAARRRMLVRTDAGIVAFGSWDSTNGIKRVSRLYLFANEADAAADGAIEHILDVASRDVSADFPAILVFCPSSDHLLTRSQAISLGFRARERESSRSGKLEKLCLGAVVTPNNWKQVRDDLMEVSGIQLPDEAPVFRTSEDHITFRASGGEQGTSPLRAFEDFVSPGIFALSGRPAAMVPIKPHFVEALFRGSVQPSFLNDEQAALLPKKRYLGSGRTYGVIPDQGLVFFYESGGSPMGRSAAVAVARIVRRYLAREAVAEQLSRDRGVLTARDVQSMAKGREVCVIEFDNVMMFQKSVSLEELKNIGCADNSNMVSARNLETAAAIELIQLGQPRCVS